jgi:ubiquinone/menaquinone biosynthesis C-methylase UbiE
MKTSILEINKRYSELASSDCCLSCGSAINYSDAKPGQVCVDLGSGRGTDAIRLAGKVGTDGFVYGIDISDGMIEKANQTASKLKINNVKFIKSEFEKIDITSNTADIVISNCSINHAANKQDVWNEIYRILKSGGSFIISDIYSISPVPEEYKNDPEAVSECWAGAVTREEYLNNIRIAGFSDINIMEESTPYEKGKIKVASWTISGTKPSAKCCGCKS